MPVEPGGRRGAGGEGSFFKVDVVRPAIGVVVVPESGPALKPLNGPLSGINREKRPADVRRCGGRVAYCVKGKARGSMNSFFVASFAWFCSLVLCGLLLFFCFFQAGVGEWVAWAFTIYDLRAGGFMGPAIVVGIF